MELTIVGLPLGNIEDISLRAIRSLDEADTIICEDTRVFAKLWQKLAVLGYVNPTHSKKLLTLTDYNEKTQYLQLLSRLDPTHKIALISDAGMPTISDPGYKLISAAIKNEASLNIVPGPTALTTALCISGLPTDKFIFQGFLPQKPQKRARVLESLTLLSKDYTIIIYESPYRIAKLISELKPYSLQITLARELTKKHQSVIRFHSSQPVEPVPKGEYVVLFRHSE